MVKEYRFNLKLDSEDRERLSILSHRLQRTRSDTVRWLIRKATGGPHPARKGLRFDPSVLDDPIAIIGDWEEWGSRGEEEPL